jgi:hypothetical protein
MIKLHNNNANSFNGTTGKVREAQTMLVGSHAWRGMPLGLPIVSFAESKFRRIKYGKVLSEIAGSYPHLPL